MAIFNFLGPALGVPSIEFIERNYILEKSSDQDGSGSNIGRNATELSHSCRDQDEISLFAFNRSNLQTFELFYLLSPLVRNIDRFCLAVIIGHHYNLPFG